MTTTTDHAEIGDVIKSDTFTCGEYQTEWVKGCLTLLTTAPIRVGGSSNPRIVNFTEKQTQGDWKREIPRTLDTQAFDLTRKDAEFLVEDARLQGGSGPHARDVYPDGWHVTARRLNDDGSYNPDGEVIQFYQSGCFTHTIGEVTVTARRNDVRDEAIRKAALDKLSADEKRVLRRLGV